MTVTAILLAGWALSSRTGLNAPATQVTHFDIGLPPGVEPYPSSGPAISPDGRSLAVIGIGARDGVRRVFVRRLDRAEAIEILDTGGANAVAFSPDSGAVAVTRNNGTITLVSLTDQQRRSVGSGSDINNRLTWSPAGIVFGRSGALAIVSPEGGTPRTLTELDGSRHEVLHDNPLVLPGAHLVLFASQTTEPGGDRIEVVSVDGGPRSVVVDRATTPVWSSTGHLLFARDGAIFAAAFDPLTAKVLGPAVQVMQPEAVQELVSGNLGLSVSSTGTLLTLPAGFTDSRLVSVGRDGAALTLDLPSGRYGFPRVSPNGRRLVVENGSAGIQALDLARGTSARLTAAGIMNFPTWSADGTRVVFRRFGAPFWASADGAGRAGPMPNTAINDYPSSPGPDPDSIIAVRIRPETSGDVFLISISGAFPPKPLIVTPAYEGGGQLSPDGRWLLYQSDASGAPEIYVRPYPALDRQWQVSEGGGVQARWSHNNREIYYRSGHRVVAVALNAAGAEPVFGRPAALFTDDYDFGAGLSVANYDATPDGRFIMIRRGPNGGKLRIVINWAEELKAILAAGGLR